MSDQWNLVRVGKAAAATTPAGQVPQYGLAFDLGSAQWESADQFRTAMRDFAAQEARRQLAQVSARAQAREEELKIATHFQRTGVAPWDKAGQSDDNFLEKAGNSVLDAGNYLKSSLGSAISSMKGGDFIYTDNEAPLPDNPYGEYKAAGGLLSEDDFSEFDEPTQAYLIGRAQIKGNWSDALETPGVKHALAAVELGYRGLQVPFNMVADAGHKNPLMNVVDPMWFQQGSWARAWRESQDQSLGNALVNSVLEPYVGSDRVDEWRRSSSIYQLTSMGVELGATWYLDPGVIAAKGAGGVSRIARNELPLNEQSQLFKATTQALQRERITVRGPAKWQGQWRAKRISAAWDDVADFARNRTYADFADLPQFRKRDLDGQSAAAALYWVFREGTPEQMDLTKQLLHGDPKAYEQLDALKKAAPVELEKFAPGAQTFIDAIEATKTKIPLLEKEAENLIKTDPRSPFHDWSLHADADAKLRDVTEAEEALSKYEGYGRWLDNLSREPMVSRVGTPGPVNRFFMDNQFGTAHKVVEWTRPLWIQRANSIEMHNLDSGAESIRRQFQQFDHLWKYQNPEALDEALIAWQSAPNAFERYKVALDVEEKYLIEGASEHFGVEPGIIRSIYDKVVTEQNKMVNALQRGDGAVYSAAPDLQGRLADGEEGIKLVSRNEDEGLVTLELMDGGRRMTVTVPDEALVQKARPVDPTQTPNYYQPIDTRAFHLALRRNEEMIQLLNQSGVRHGEAWLMDRIDAFGTKFNNLWKPLQLFRLGWPQRVLMDEQMRAMAVLGIAGFAQNYLPDTARAFNNAAVKVADSAHNMLNVYRDTHAPLLFGKDFKAGRRMNIGPGPVAESLKRKLDPVARDTEALETPRVPESYVPKLDNKRFAKVTDIAAEYDAYKRGFDKYQAWQRYRASGNLEFHPGRRRNVASDLQMRLYDHALDSSTAYPGVRPDHPAFRIAKQWDEEVWDTAQGGWILGKAKSKGPRVYDPITAKPIKSGYVVPLPHTMGKVPDLDSPGDHTLADWYAKNRELLGSRNHRVFIDPEGNIMVGVHFSSKGRRNASELAQYIDGPMFDLGRKLAFQVKDYNDLSPTTEAAYRQFVSHRPMERQDGEAPFGGPKRLEARPPHVFHGTDRELPDDLLPREDAPMDTGHMVGEGFYTTTNLDVAEGFAQMDPHVYTIKGSKDGRTYRIFDMDKVPSGRDLKKLKRWLDELEAQAGKDSDTYYRTHNLRDVFFNSHPDYIYRYYDNATGDPTWLDYMNTMAIVSSSAQRLLTRFLEEKYGAGALTHSGGLLTGNKNRVYVWLDPENLLVRPLYAQSDKYVPLIEWLSNPLSKEVPVPENRILRKGDRNPLFRELHQNHAALVEHQNSLEGVDKYIHPDVDRRLQREQEIMHQLGLEYTHNKRPGDPEPNVNIGQDWYMMRYPMRFERMVDAAKREDAERMHDIAMNTELRHHELDVDELDPEGQFDFDLDSVQSRVYRAVLRRREGGRGVREEVSSDGKKVQVPDAYAGHDGELMRSLISSQGAVEALSDGHGAALSLMRRQARGHKTYHPPVLDDEALTPGTKANKLALEYFHQWSDLLNTQIAHSPIWNKMLNGWSDEKIVNWLNSTPEGSQVKREVMHEGREPELWVNEHRAKLNYYLPSRKLQRLLGKGRVNTSQLRKEIPEDQLPDVFGPDIEFLSKQEGAGKALGWIMDRIWYGLGTVPIDTLSRHPFAKAMYDLKMRSLVNTTDSKWLDEETLGRFERQSRNYAREQVRRTLWDLSDQTNFTDALRFVAPFWGAQQEAIVKWGKIVVDRPETVQRMFNLQRAVYNNFLMVDEDGQPVERDFYSYNPTDRVVMRVPSAMRNTALGKALETIGSVGIPLGSANTVLQGETPLLPGPGPLVTIPADKFLRATSDIYGTQYDEAFLYRWLFPIGRPQNGGVRGVLDQLVPGWGKRVMSLNDGDGGVAYANLYTEVAREMELENQRKGLPEPTPEEIEQQARWVWGLRIVAGLTSPVQTQFRPKHQFLIDAAHKYQRDYGQEWFDKFMQDYGTSVARYAASSSNTLISIPPTSEGMEEWAQNKKLIAKYPEWGGAILSPDAYQDDFSSDAYYAQFQINLGPGDSRTLREPQSTTERFAEADARAGWFEFRRVQVMLDAELANRGLHSLQQKGAEDLAAMKRNFVADLSDRLPAWRDEYDNFSNDIYTRIGELQKFAFRREFDKRPDMQGVRQYLILRDQVGAELDSYAATTGGSRSLQAEENTGLRDWFYNQVGQLVQANPAFGEFYARYLTQDTLEQGSGE